MYHHNTRNYKSDIENGTCYSRTNCKGGMRHAIWQEAFTTIQPMNYTCQADYNKRAQLSAANLQFQGRGQLYLRLYLSITFMSSTILEAAPACLHCIFISFWVFYLLYAYHSTELLICSSEETNYKSWNILFVAHHNGNN